MSALLQHYFDQSEALPILHIGIVIDAESDISSCRTPE